MARGFAFGAMVGFIGLYQPDTLTWGEFQIQVLAQQRAPFEVGSSTLLAIAKFFSITITVASGYGAGIVYPLVMVGYLCGPLAAYILHPDSLNNADACSTGEYGTRDVGVELLSQV